MNDFPSDVSDLGPLFGVLRRVRRRMRAQAALEGAARAGLPAGAITLGGIGIAKVAAMLDFSSGWVMPGPGWWLGGGALVIVAGALVGGCRRLGLDEVAHRIDVSHVLSDRCRSALELSALGSRTPMMQAAIEDASRAVSRVLLRRAAPFSRPRFVGWSAALLVSALALAMVPVRSSATGRTHETEGARSTVMTSPREPALAMDPVLFEPERAAAEELRDEARAAGDESARRVASELLGVLDGIEARELPARDVIERLSRLAGEAGSANDVDAQALREAMREAGRALESAESKARPPALSELAEALGRGDLVQAARAAASLQEEMRRKKTPMPKSLAEALARALAALKIRPPESLADMVPPDMKPPEGMQDAAKQLARAGASKAQGSQGQQGEKAGARGGASREGGNGEARAGGGAAGAGAGDAGGTAAGTGASASEAAAGLSEALGRAERSARGRGLASGLKEMVQRDVMAAHGGASGAAPGERRGTEAAKGAATNAQGEKRDDHGMKQDEHGVKRDEHAVKQGGGDGRGARAEALRDFLRRAGSEPNARGTAGKGAGRGQGAEARPEGARGEERVGTGAVPGDSHDPELFGKEAAADSRVGPRRMNTAEVEASGPGEAGRAETIRGTSARGFATRPYRRAWEDYSAISDEVMERDHVPPGYRHVVRRYFQLIRPR